MAVKTISDNPTISDTIQVYIETTDSNENPINPYKVDQVVIYFIERSFSSGDLKSYTESIGDAQELTTYYTDAIPVETYGDPDNPAWLSTDTTNSLIEQRLFDDDGNALIGNFTVTWEPKMAREGDYVICWKWTPLIASPKQSAHIIFYVHGDQQATTVMPSHITPSDKYEKLLNLYTPEMYKKWIAAADKTPDVIARMNTAVGKGFTTLENLVNQLPDLTDANATHEYLLPYLANFFKQKLRSNDPTLWRRQIKRAIPLNKKKGTLSGLTEALASAGFTLQKLTKYWQIVSPYTWTESFVVTEDGQTEFTLAKEAYLPMNADNFSIKIRANDDTEYTELSLNYVSFSSDKVTWIGDELNSGAITLMEGDIILITYQIAEVLDQDIEDYIRSLQLMDARDETTFIYPLKNWNVHLIAEDDAMFDMIISTKHPFAPPVVYGKVRTEFAYSENIFNMEEYNASLRNSNYPCDIDRTFLDKCSACRSSSITLDLEMEDISDDRIREALEIVKDYVPFHTQVRSINYSGAVNEFVPPPTEDIEILVHKSMEEFVMAGQGDFTRTIPILNTTLGQFLRDELSTSMTVATGVATGFNGEVVLYSPGIMFGKLGITSDNLLEILDGSNAGSYTVSETGTNVIKINQGSPDSISFPLDTSAFVFRLSNLIWTDATATITQDDLFIFSDENENFTIEAITGDSTWQIRILSGIYTGTYTILDTLPDGSLILSGWSGTTAVTALSYNLTRNDDTVVLNGSTGELNVTRRGKVTTQELESWGVTQGYYLAYSGTQYKISGFADDEKTQPYILDYEDGDAAGVTIDVYQRVLDNNIGYVDIRGMYIITTPDYEALLSIQNGSNPPSDPLENSSFKENYLVLIGSSYYTVTSWNSTRIDLSGPKTTWGLSGTLLDFELINFIIDAPKIAGYFNTVEFSEGIDRRGNAPVITESEVVGMPLDVCLSSLNSDDGVVELVGTEESISFKIQKRDGTIKEGDIKCN